MSMVARRFRCPPGMGFAVARAFFCVAAVAAGEAPVWETAAEDASVPASAAAAREPRASVGEGRLSVEITAGGQSRAALLRLIGEDGQNRLRAPGLDGEYIDGRWSGPVPAGDWRVEISSSEGWTLIRNVRVPPGRAMVLPMEIPEGYSVRAEEGWVAFDPWVSDASAEPDASPHSADARLDLARRAAGLDAIAYAGPAPAPRLAAAAGYDPDGLSCYALASPELSLPDDGRLASEPSGRQGVPGVWHRTLSRWRRAGAWVVLHRPRSGTGSGELPFLAAAGAFIDAVDLGDGDDETFRLWCAWLSRGRRLAPSAGGPGSGGEAGEAPPAIGLRLASGGRADPDALLAALRAGRVMAGNGPWLGLDVDGAGPGDLLPAGPGSRILNIQARSSAARPLAVVECWYNDRRVQTWSARGGSLEARSELLLPHPGWLLLRGRGAESGGAWAVTAPIYVAADGGDGARPAGKDSPPPGVMRAGVWLRRDGRGAAGWAEAFRDGLCEQRFAVPPGGATVEIGVGARLRLGLGTPDDPGAMPAAVWRDPYRDSGLADWLARAADGPEGGSLFRRREFYDALDRRLAALRLVAEW